MGIGVYEAERWEKERAEQDAEIARMKARIEADGKEIEKLKLLRLGKLYDQVGVELAEQKRRIIAAIKDVGKYNKWPTMDHFIAAIESVTEATE